MAAHPGCWSRPADNLAPSARGAKCLVCDAVHTRQGSAGAGGVRGQNAAKTEPLPVEALCRGLLSPSLTTAPCPSRGDAQGCREMHRSPHDKCGQVQPSNVGGAGPRKATWSCHMVPPSRDLISAPRAGPQPVLHLLGEPESEWGCAGKSWYRESGACALVLVVTLHFRAP